VVVHHGEDPIADLTKNDFEVYDQGVKQEIATLSVEGIKPLRA